MIMNSLNKLKFIDSFRFMLTSLSSLVDNLSDIYKKECELCKERKKIMWVCRLIDLKNNELYYECKNVMMNHINQ